MIYLDNQATTPLAPEAREAMLRHLDGPDGSAFANPHSPHRMGRMAAAAVEAAREKVAALFPPGKIFPKGIASQSIARMPLRVVAAKGSADKRSYKLKDFYTRGWVINPDGCGFRAGLQRALSEQGLSLSINLETFGTELQLGLVANGQGLGLVPAPLLEGKALQA